MIDLWFTKEQIEAEEKVGRFNSPWDERSFRSRILQDWLTMYAENEKLRRDLVHEQINHSIKNNLVDRLAAELEAAEAALRKVAVAAEWAVNIGGDFSYCPVCANERRDGHAPDCEIRKALKGGEG